MITRKLDNENIFLLADSICKYWEYLDDNLVVLFDLFDDAIRVATKDEWRDETEYEVTEQELLEMVKGKNGPDLPRNDEDEKIEPETDEDFQALKNWLSEHYNQITIIDDNIKICRNCYKTIDDDHGEYYHEYKKPDKDGLRYICGECYEDLNEAPEDIIIP